MTIVMTMIIFCRISCKQSTGLFILVNIEVEFRPIIPTISIDTMFGFDVKYGLTIDVPTSNIKLWLLTPKDMLPVEYEMR